MPKSREPARRGILSAQVGLLVNTALAAIKIVAGIAGRSQALIADGIESTADVFSSMVVWSGLRIASRSADEEYPFGYGKAEALAAAVVGLLLLAAALAIAVESIRQIMIPHLTPRPFTLGVLVGVMLVKEVLFRRVLRVGADVGSTAVQADAWHHRSDVITSGAAFIGISIALIGGPGWESADDWAALVASTIIAYNGIGVLRPAVHDLMDRAPGEEMLARVRHAATAVGGVRAIEKLKVRKAGLGYWVDLHVQADPGMPLEDAHVLSGMVKSAIRDAVPEVSGALIHMEPFEGEGSGAGE
ncbi:MAG TPA: cation diffusion facilitator family transporter [Gemmatimonadales bacterium]|nr:cation diffusion facilitator family transporter [Gemmatimonadales bacterium]